MPVTRDRRALMVVGMHRSGTSATAGALGLLGGTLPNALMPPIPGDNDVGFFEPSRIVEIHNELLATAGSSWDDTSPLPEAWFNTRAAHAFGQRLKATYIEEYGDAPLTVLKDPRVCRFLPVWREILASLDVTPLFVMPFRHPMEVASSLARRNAFPALKSHILWLQHVLLAEHGSRGEARAFLAYEELLANPRRALTRLSEDLGIKWPATDAFAQVEQFLSRKHHHNRAFGDAPRPEDVGGLVAATFSMLEGLIGPPGPAQAAALDQIRTAYLEADRLLGPLGRQLQAALDHATKELAVLHVELEHCRHERGEVDAQRTRTRELEKQIHALSADCEHRLEDAQALATSNGLLIQRLNQAIADRDRELAAARETIAGLQAQVDAGPRR